MDLLVPLLAQFTSVAAATKGFLVLSQLLIVSGSVALEIVVQKRHQLSGFVALSSLYAVPFSLGLLNSEFGIGLALWGIAFWIMLERSAYLRRTIVHSVFVCVLYITHLIALGIYGAVIGFYMLPRIWRCISNRGLNAREVGANLAILAGPAIVVFGYVLFSGAKVGSTGTKWIVSSKLLALMSLLNGYSTILSAISFVVVVLLVYSLYKNSAISFTEEGKWVASGLVLLFFVMPFQIAGSAYDDTRVAITSLLILPAFIKMPSKSKLISFLPATAFGVIAVLNFWQVTSVWASFRPALDNLKSSFSLLHRGAFVLVARSDAPLESPDDLNGPLLRYAPVLAVHYSAAFVPSLFSMPGMYAVQVSSPQKHLEITKPSFYDPAPFQILRAAMVDDNVQDLPSFLRCWPLDYDYLYLIGPSEENPMPSLLLPLMRDPRFALFQVKKSSTSAPMKGRSCGASLNLGTEASRPQTFTNRNLGAPNKLSRNRVIPERTHGSAEQSSNLPTSMLVVQPR
jgi:hypothetical protein